MLNIFKEISLFTHLPTVPPWSKTSLNAQVHHQFQEQPSVCIYLHFIAKSQGRAVKNENTATTVTCTYKPSSKYHRIVRWLGSEETSRIKFQTLCLRQGCQPLDQYKIRLPRASSNLALYTSSSGQHIPAPHISLSKKLPLILTVSHKQTKEQQQNPQMAPVYLFVKLFLTSLPQK